MVEPRQHLVVRVTKQSQTARWRLQALSSRKVRSVGLFSPSRGKVRAVPVDLRMLQSIDPNELSDAQLWRNLRLRVSKRDASFGPTHGHEAGCQRQLSLQRQHDATAPGCCHGCPLHKNSDGQLAVAVQLPN
jgi:hypothetical protein